MDGEAVVAAFAQFEAARAALTALPVDMLTAPQILAITEMRERGRRSELSIDHALTTHLVETATPNELGATSFKELLANRLHITAKDAGQRLADATQLGPRHTLLGDRVATELAHTAAVLAHGDIGTDHVHIIAAFIDELPSFVDAAARDEFERLLAKSATTMRPEQLKAFAAELTTYLDQDGTEPDPDTHRRRRELHVGPQQSDGMSRVSGWITPEARAHWDVIEAKDAAPGANLPHDDTHTQALTGRDDRTAAQRRHDAFTSALRHRVESGSLGQLAGVPATIVATTTVGELERAAGWAHTGGGNKLPIQDLIRMAARSSHYLAVFDDHTEEPLYLGRARRCATTAQRLALFARDLGCTHPHCTVPFYGTQAHHTNDYSTGGQTNIDELTLACQPANLLVENTGYTTERPGNGRTHWIPPTHLDTGQPRVNNHFHPHRYLTDRDDDDDPE